MKLKGCEKPGEWYVLPLCYHHHQGKHGIHANKKEFEERFTTEKLFWTTIIENYEHQFGKKPMSEEEYQIILERA